MLCWLQFSCMMACMLFVTIPQLQLHDGLYAVCNNTTTARLNDCNCTAAVSLKKIKFLFYKVTKGGSSEPPRTPPGYGPAPPCSLLVLNLQRHLVLRVIILYTYVHVSRLSPYISVWILFLAEIYLRMRIRMCTHRQIWMRTQTCCVGTHVL